MPVREPKYWLHRISHERKVSYPLYKAGYLPIGWGEFGTDELLPKLQNNFDGTIDEEWGQLNRNRFSLQNFISKMKRGDYVVVPQNGTFDIVRIKGDKVLTAETLCREKSDLLKSLNIEKEDAQNRLKVDLGFFWEIELVCDNISRKKYDNIARKLQYRGTNLDISDIRGAISQLIKKTDISMRNVRLVRTFHPVGHGAFYTEQFYDDKNKCVFTAVYDCGSKLKKEDFENYLDHHLRGEQIDALFISHMHRDHISGIEHLLRNNNCKKIFLPQLTKGQRLALLVQNIVTAIDDSSESTPDEIIKEDDAFQVLKWCYSEEGEFNTRIVRVPFIENPKEGYEGASKDIEECKGTLNKGESIKVLLNTHFDWIYFPMNLKNDITIDFGDLLDGVTDDDNTENIDFNKLAEICADSKKWKKIVSTYNKFIDSSIANEYSMTVYSGYAYPHRADDVFVHCICDCDYYYCSRPACYDRCHNIRKSGCLYMGDFLAENKNVDNLIKFYGKYHANSDVIQVPHHGSRKLKKDTDKYGFQLCDNCKIGVISTQFGLYNEIPAADVIQALKTNRVCPKIITQKYFTELKLDYYLR